ncbi:MAG: apolipoprotein N-acyltransferase [Proteobacteria bacterium]|nr:apolipoprotein N-acyltransferase [Pseudomonadota bacterium]
MSIFNKENGLALLAGLSCVSGFAPLGLFPIPVLALAVLFVLWGGADTPRAAARLGFAFGLGLFSAGIAWIYIALHDFGDMPMWLAAPATLLFAAFLSLFTALAGYLQAFFNVKFAPRFVRPLLVMPAVWVLIEWLRGMIFTGFPWLTLGYAHSDSPLAGYAPLLGVYGVSLVAAKGAGLLAVLWRERWNKQGQIALAAFAMLWGSGALLRNVAWTQPLGAPFTVTLVQGNIGQDVKFNPDVLNDTLDAYRRQVLQNPARLTVLPETALPMMRDEMPQALVEQLREHAKRNGGDVLTGVFEHDSGGYYNSVIALGASEDAFAAEQPHYRKHHLVIFGEFIPLRPVFGWLINEVLHIPMGDLARGDISQAPLSVAGQRVAVDICYEDVFGEEIITALPAATLLVNVTNDGWYGNSFAAAQHNQMSQFRAMETGRMMLRATNTGVSSIIGVNGHVLQQLPQHQLGVLQGQVQGYNGSTPYVRWGNAAVLLLIALMLSGSMYIRNAAR